MEILKRNSDYAVRALVHLTDLERGSVVSAGTISAAERIPEALLRKLLQKLCRADLVASERGVRGGFRLARRPKEITMLDVVEAVQGKVAINRCFLGKRLCPNQPRCRISTRLVRAQDELVGFFKGITLADLTGELGPSRRGPAGARRRDRKKRRR